MSRVDVPASFPLIGCVVPEEHDENIRESSFVRIGSFTKCSPRSESSPSPASGMALVLSRQFQIDWNSNPRTDDKSVGRHLHRDVVLLRLMRQRHEASESARSTQLQSSGCTLANKKVPRRENGKAIEFTAEECFKISAIQRQQDIRPGQCAEQNRAILGPGKTAGRSTVNTSSIISSSPRSRFQSELAAVGKLERLRRTSSIT